MIIRVLMASEDARYITRLSETVGRTPLDTGDVLEIALFTDSGKLAETLSGTGGRRTRYDAAMVDESMAGVVSGAVPVVLALTDDNARDGLPCAEAGVFVYKFQRVSDIIKKLLLALAQKRVDEGKGNGLVCGFFSPQGGSGTSSMAAAYAFAAARAGLTPLFVSLEHFNTTEMFFTGGDNSDNAKQGLLDVFFTIAQKGGVSAAIDAVKVKDASGVLFLNRFPMWMEVAQLGPGGVEVFINAARSAFGVNLVVLDLGSGFTPFTETALQCVDEIFVVAGACPLAALKLKMLFEEEPFFFQEYSGKSNLIYNKAVKDDSKNSFGCKSVTFVPAKQGGSANDAAKSAAENLAGLVVR